MQKMFLKKSLVIIILFISGILSPLLNADNLTDNEVLVSFTIYSKSDVINCKAKLSYDEITFINDLFRKLQYEIIYHPFTNETKNLKLRFIEFLNKKGLIPDDITNDEIIELLGPTYIQMLKQNKFLNSMLSSLDNFSSKASAFFCSVASGGTGKTTPMVIGPWPHAIILWSGVEGQDVTLTTVEKISTGKGFIAYGNQDGILIGFEGMGLTYDSIFGTVYGLAGFAVYTSVTADDIVYYPPNIKPEISNPNPLNNQEDVPITLSELSFQIHDDDNDLMDYSVSTEPFIGSDSKKNVHNGIYTMSVNGLKDTTTYTWTVTVTDRKDTTTSTFNFKTPYITPIISDPYPSEGSINVLIDQSHLSFSISDPQNDSMNYSVETSPNIGSKSESNVLAGSYEVPIYDLKYNTSYIWYLNVTDGVNWKKEIFTFKTLPKGLFIFYPTDDTYISQSNPNEILGSNINLNFRSLNDESNWRILIKFDFSLISPDIEILYAKLFLYYYTWNDNNPVGNKMSIYRLTSNWNEESANWENHPLVAHKSSSQSFVPDSCNIWMSWNVTKDVIKFISGDESNFGWLLHDETYWNGANIPMGRFYSKEYGSYIPYIEIRI